MNIRAFSFAFALALQSLVAEPLKQQALPKAKDGEQVIESITTLSGKTYLHCRIYKIDPDGVMFFHDRGGCKVLFLDLPQDLKTKLGHNPEKEAAYRGEHATKIREQREQAAAMRKAVAAQAAMVQWSQAGYAAAPGYSYPDMSYLPPGDLFYPAAGIAAASGLAGDNFSNFSNYIPRWLNGCRRFTDRVAWNNGIRSNDGMFFAVPPVRTNVPALHGPSPVLNTQSSGTFVASRPTTHVVIPAQASNAPAHGGGGHGGGGMRR